MVSRRQSVRVLENKGNSSESELHFDHWSEWQFLFRDALPSVYGHANFEHIEATPLLAYLRKSEKVSGSASKVVDNCLPPNE
jgi:hypothetical protein